MMIIDAEGAVLGRLASHTAKYLLRGEQVVVVNAEKAVISGSPTNVYAKYKQRLDRGNLANPTKANKFPRVPDQIVRRTIRGMVNFRTTRGAKAFKRLTVVMGMPKEYAEKAEKYVTPSPTRKVTILELSRMLGWKGGE